MRVYQLSRGRNTYACCDAKHLAELILQLPLVTPVSLTVHEMTESEYINAYPAINQTPNQHLFGAPDTVRQP